MAPKKTKKSAAPKKAKRSRGRRKAKETKAETVEVSNGVQLLLGIGNGPQDEELVRDFELLMNLMAKSATAAGRVSEQKSKMKDKGIDVKAVMNTMRLERLAPEDLARELQQQQRLMKARGLPIQVELFEAKYDSPEAQAKVFGFKDGKDGRSQDASRWPEGTPAHQAYVDAWVEGQKQMPLLQGAGEGHYKGAGDE